MSTISERQKERIAKLMSDPRYWDKEHPEHTRVFADAQRAFQDAYPEAKPDKRTPGTVHVRAYSRTQDGKEIQVSEYDRTQQIAFHPLGSPQSNESDLLRNVAEGPVHKAMKEYAAQHARAQGDIVETEVPVISIQGIPTTLDLVGKAPNGWLYALEFKTPGYDSFGANQMLVYPFLDLGNHVFSASPKIRSFGFLPGQPLPPICIYGVFLKKNGETKVRSLGSSPACQ